MSSSIIIYREIKQTKCSFTDHRQEFAFSMNIPQVAFGKVLKSIILSVFIVTIYLNVHLEFEPTFNFGDSKCNDDKFMKNKCKAKAPLS